MGEIVTSIEIGHVIKHNVLLLVIQNLNVPAILGMDTLQKFGSFGIGWTHLTLTLGDAKLLLDKRCHGSYCRLLLFPSYRTMSFHPVHSALCMLAQQIMDQTTRMLYFLPSWIKWPG